MVVLMLQCDPLILIMSLPTDSNRYNETLCLCHALSVLLCYQLLFYGELTVMFMSSTH